MENKRRLTQDKLNKASSKRKGALGLLENMMRKFHTFIFLSLISPIAIIYAACIGISVTPGVLIFKSFGQYTENSTFLVQAIFTGMSIGCGFVLYILSIIIVVPIFNFFLPLKVKHYRGPWTSVAAIPWFVHNALTYLVRYTALDFITPSPLNIFFYRMMGMKIGKGVLLNSSNISDPCLIVLEDYVTIGGSATLMAHYGMKGYLIIDKLKIGERTTIGLNANILGGVTIGKNCSISPNAVILPKSKVEDGSII